MEAILQKRPINGIKRKKGNWLKTWAIYLTVFLLCVLFTGTYILVRPDLTGVDTYHYLNYACGKIDAISYGKSPAIPLIVGALPCDVLSWKLLLFGMMLFCSFMACLTGKKLHEKLLEANPQYWKHELKGLKGEMAGIWLFLTPLWCWLFFKIEPLQLSLPFLFLAFYLFVSERRWLTLGAILAACYVWPGNVFFLIGYKSRDRRNCQPRDIYK